MKGFKVSDNQLLEAIKQTFSMRAMLMSLGLSPTKGNYDTCWARIRLLNANTDHWCSVQLRTTMIQNTYSLDEILVENSPYKSRTRLKRRLIREGVLEEKCNICRGTNIWEGKRLVLVLDHINGNPKDNRIENLRLLCPNCNSQQETFAGRNIKTMQKHSYKCIKCETRISRQRYYRYDSTCADCRPPRYRKNKIQHLCEVCSKPVTKNSRLCWECYVNSPKGKFLISYKELEALMHTMSLHDIALMHNVHIHTVIARGRKLGLLASAQPRHVKEHLDKQPNKSKIEITKEQLLAMIWEIPTEQIGKLFGVSGKAIEKRCKRLGIEKPPRGYWAKKRANKL